VYLINGQQPGPLIEAEEGDDLEVFVNNQLSVETTIHWHGLLQTGTPDMDGVPGVTQVSTRLVLLRSEANICSSVPNPIRRQFHLPIFNKGRIRLLLVSLTLPCLLRRRNKRPTPYTSCLVPASALWKPRGEFGCNEDNATGRAGCCIDPLV